MVIGVGLVGLVPVRAGGPTAPTLYVDCSAMPGGTGSRRAPFDTITAAVSAGRPLSAVDRVAIDVAAGTCNRETLPIRLDYPVEVRGKRLPEFDQRGWPTGEQRADTLVLSAASPAPVPFFLITGDDVRLSRLSIDGRFDPGPDTPGPSPAGPTGVTARTADGFVIEHVRFAGLAQAIRSEGASGRIASNYVENANFALGLFGGDSVNRPYVVVVNNRIDYRANGIILGGGIPAAGPTPGGTSLTALVLRNDVVTRYANTGPSNPAALRMSPAIGTAPDGDLDALFLFNEVRGTPAYSIIVHAGQPVRDSSPSTGSLRITFYGTVLDDDAERTSRALITFTNARATVLPCELNPANDRTVCPSLLGNPPLYSDYLEGTAYELWHGGELDSALIDHPEIEPVDGRVLGNVLRLNGRVIDYETFVVVPG